MSSSDKLLWIQFKCTNIGVILLIKLLFFSLFVFWRRYIKLLYNYIISSGNYFLKCEATVNNKQHFIFLVQSSAALEWIHQTLNLTDFLQENQILLTHKSYWLIIGEKGHLENCQVHRFIRYHVRLEVPWRSTFSCRALELSSSSRLF